jgi:polyhydroxyalkanoate synthase
MFSFCDDLHRIYQEDYNKYVDIDRGFDNYKHGAFKCDYDSSISSVWLFKSKTSSNQNFIVIPSLFNSPKILFFNQEQNYIEYMQLLGNVYLLEWKETKEALKLSDYAHEVAKVLQFTENTNSGDVNLVGHCIGGNISIFSMFIYNNVRSLTLLTTPWDYSHFATSHLLSECLEIKKAIYGLETVPKIYVQMMFFMLFPNHYQTKVNKYFALDKIEAREKYLRIEQWLQSGIDIPSSLYNEILDDVIAKNILVNKNLYVNERLVSLDKIDIPTCIISAKEDQIAPLSSIVPLQKEIKKSTLISVEGGHINYLVNNDQKFKQEYTNWFKTS